MRFNTVTGKCPVFMYMEFFLLPIPLKCFKTTSFSVQPFTHTTMAMTTLQSAAYSSGTFTHTHTLIGVKRQVRSRVGM